MQHDVFISYSHDSSGKDVARELATRLRNDGVNIWFDQFELLPGTRWAEEIDQAISDSRIIVFLVDQGAEKNKWFLKELNRAKELNKWIVPVLIAGTSPKDLPEELQTLQAINFDTDDTVKNIEILLARIFERKPIWSRIKEYIVNDS